MAAKVDSNRLVGLETSTSRKTAVSLGGSLSLDGNVLMGHGNSVTDLEKKSSDEDVTSSTTFQDDDDLVIPVISGEVWAFSGYLICSAGSVAPDIKLQFTGPTGNFFFSWARLGSTQVGLVTALNASTGKIDLTATSQVITFQGTFDPTADGDLQLQWAQFASNVAFTRVETGSHILATRKVV